MVDVADMLAGRHLAGTSFAAYDAAARTPYAADWATDYKDPNWVFAQEGEVLGSRSEDGHRNNPVIAAAIDTMLSGTLGDSGLHIRSQFAKDDDPETDTHEDLTRRLIDASFRRATSGTRFDAQCRMSWRELLECTMGSAMLTGNGVGLRVIKPRYGRQYQSTCVRLVHSSRICNPYGASDTDRMHRGWELDEDGTPIAVHVRRYRLMGDRIKDDWKRVPIWGFDGARQVTHLRTKTLHADQLLGVPFLAPILSLLKQFGGVTDAYVVAKRIQACYPIVITTKDPTVIAQAMRNGTLLTTGTKIKPGTVYICRDEDAAQFENLTFNGQDHMAFAESLLQLACAALGLPYEVVINRLSKSNLASARAALMAGYRTFRIWQNMLITQVIEPWFEWIIREDIARGRLNDLRTDDLDLILRAKYLRPAMPTPDLKKDIGAVRDFVDLGGAPSDGFAMVGLPDFTGTVVQRGQDDRTMDAQGVVFGALSKASTPTASQPSDPNADPTDPTDPADPADGEDGGEDPTDPGTT